MTADSEFRVHVVDDDSAVRRSLRLSLVHEGYTVLTYSSAEEFFEAYDPDDYGCIILDIRMPGMKGLEVQEILNERRNAMPIIFITGHASVPMSVRAIKRGAVDFLEKPFRRQTLLQRIEEARAEYDARRHHLDMRSEIERRLKLLTQRETEVLLLLVRNKPMTSSKLIGSTLDISPRTAEQHRASILNKMNVDSVAELGVLLTRASIAIQPLTDEDRSLPGVG